MVQVIYRSVSLNLVCHRLLLSMMMEYLQYHQLLERFDTVSSATHMKILAIATRTPNMLFLEVPSSTRYPAKYDNRACLYISCNGAADWPSTSDDEKLRDVYQNSTCSTQEDHRPYA